LPPPPRPTRRSPICATTTPAGTCGNRCPTRCPPRWRRFRALGLPLVVVSNSNGTLRAKLERLGLADAFDHVLDSHEEGVEKPDPRIFHAALARAGARPEHALHVGDLYEIDVVGARAAGVHAILLDVADLYREVDCPRVRTLAALADKLAGAGGFQ